MLQNKAFQELRSYLDETFPDDRDRFPRLLLRLPPLRAFLPHIMEELFFAGIETVHVEGLVPLILKPSSENSALGSSYYHNKYTLTTAMFYLFFLIIF